MEVIVDSLDDLYSGIEELDSNYVRIALDKQIVGIADLPVVFIYHALNDIKNVFAPFVDH